MKLFGLLAIGSFLLFGCATGSGDIFSTGGGSSDGEGGSGNTGNSDFGGMPNGGSTNVSNPTTSSPMNTTSSMNTTTTSSMNTSTTTGPGCTGSQFDCGNGQCLPAAQECDQTQQCANGADESPTNPSCSPTTNSTMTTTTGGGCQIFEIPCNDGTCIPIFFVCDGFDDCAGGEDEQGCGSSGWTCDPSYEGDGECDCGCGTPDPDCPSASSADCLYCTDPGSCATTDCSEINPNDNSTCI